MSLFGIDLNFSVLPIYLIGLFQWILVLALFSKEHPLYNEIQYGTYVLLVFIVFDVLSMVMIKKHVASEWAIFLHNFFCTIIGLFTESYAMILAILIHKFYRNSLPNEH